MRGQFPDNQCTTEVPVTMEIQQSNNNAPEFVLPPNRNSVINVLEVSADTLES